MTTEAMLTPRQLRVLLNLEEVCRLTADGERVTIRTFAARVHVTRARTDADRYRVADRNLRLCFDVARPFGHEVKLVPPGEIGADQGAPWVVAFDDLAALREKLSAEISALVDEMAPSPREELELEERAKAFAVANETEEDRARRRQAELTRYNRQRYLENLSRGRCVQCRSRPSGGGIFCVPCAESHRVRARERYRAHRARGLCGYCTSPAESGRATCAFHAARVREADRKHYILNLEKRRARGRNDRARARELGLCCCCKKEPAIVREDGSRAEKCARCHARDLATRQDRIARGVCPECGKEPALPGRQLGPVCRERNLRHKRAWRARKSKTP